MRKNYNIAAAALFSGIMFLSGIAHAQNLGSIVREVPNPFAKNGKTTNKKISHATTDTPKITTIQKSESETVPVNITLVYDGDKYFADFMFFHNSVDPNKGEYIELPGENTFTAMIPKGSYWVNIIYRNKDVNPGPDIHIIKEEVVLTDETSLTFDAAEAINLITFQPLTPDGEIALSDLVDENLEVIEPGNIQGGLFSATIETVIYEENKGSFSSLWGDGGRMIRNGNLIDNDRRFDILVNPLSKRFSCTQVRIMCNHEGNPIVTDMGSYLDKSYTVSNDYHDYQFVENQFLPSLNNDPDKKMMDYGVCYCSGYNNVITGNLSSYSMGFTTPKSYLGLSDLSSYTKSTSPFVYLRYFELRDNSSWQPEVGISSAPYTNVGSLYEVFNYTDGQYFAGIFTTDATGLTQLHPSQVYNHTSHQCDPIYGNTVPFVSFIPMITYSESIAPGYVPNFDFSFVGMNGEIRGSDKYAASLDVRYNGNSVFNSMTQVNGWCWGWFADGANRGEYDLTVIDENLKIGDMIGRNETLIHFNTSNATDCVPPLMTWMQYRDNTDFVSNSIKEKESARVLISAGDFEFNCDENWNLWFTCQETRPQVKVEYAPHGSSEYSDMAVQDYPGSSMPGFGFQYEVELEQVSRKAPDGWFDLRVSLADAAGNSQTQLMSPAFRLEDQSGVESVIEVLEGVHVVGRNIIAPEGATIYRTDGLITNGQNVQPGIYVVRCSDRAVKLIVK